MGATKDFADRTADGALRREAASAAPARGQQAASTSVKSLLRSRFPKAWNRLRTVQAGLRLAPRLFGHYPRTCNICGYEGKFLAEIHFPDIFVYDAVCPQCSSQPRHRLLQLGIAERGFVTGQDRMLHFAPERSLSDRLRAIARRYVTADINPAGVDRQEDIHNLSLADATFDVVLCSHVLEHVDHRRALSELYRVLTPGGRLLAFFPIVEGWEGDYENPEVDGGELRGVHFGKDNHLRRFGRNVRQAIRDAGFQLEDFTADGVTSVKYGLIPGEVLFVGTKPAG